MMDNLRPCPLCGSEGVKVDPKVHPSFMERWACSTLRMREGRELIQSRRCQLHAEAVSKIDTHPPK